MPKSGNSAEELAARRVQNVLQIPYTEALRLLRAAKVPEVNWGTAADVVIEDAIGPGLPIEVE